MNLKELLEELDPHLIGVRYVNKVPTVDALFGDGWVIPRSEQISCVLNDNSMNYYVISFVSKTNNDVDILINYLRDIIKINYEISAKKELYKVFVAKLKNLVQSTPIKDLEKLKFVIGDDESDNEIEFDTTPQITQATPQTISQDNSDVKKQPTKNSDGTCNYGPNEACDVCIDEKQL